MKHLLFSFADLSTKDKAAKAAARHFARAGASVVQQDVGTTIKRAAGVSYRELILTFADSQQVIWRIKQTGDIYQVLLNGKPLPLKHQDDHARAITEIVKAMESGRSRFQKTLARARVKLPPSIRTAAPKLEQSLTDKRDALKAAIAEVRAQIDAGRAEIATLAV